MSSFIITGGRVIDPSAGLDIQADVWVQNTKIAALGKGVREQAPPDTPEIKADGCVVSPGLIDSHVHLREPGQSAKETIGTGTAAAAAGGFTSVVCMPNTSPVIDNPGTVALIQEKIAKQARVNVFVAGAITKNIDGEELAQIGSLKQEGVVAITDDGKCIQNNDLMRRAMEYARMFDLPVLDHCQDYSLVMNGVMNEGYWSTALGLRGWPSAGEDLIVSRNIILAELTGTHVHCQHLGTAGSIRLIREAKDRGVPISGEACPHHFTLTDAAIAGSKAFWKHDGGGVFNGEAQARNAPAWPEFDTRFKMNPPLRSAADREHILEALVDGTLEIIGSDHAPHCGYEKEVEFDYAPFGITGLEVELPLSLMQLYHSGRMKLPDLLAKMTRAPEKVLRLGKGTLAVGADADITVIDPEKTWIYRASETHSKSQNCPFDGWEMKGKAVATLVAGKVVWNEDSFPVPPAN